MTLLQQATDLELELEKEEIEIEVLNQDLEVKKGWRLRRDSVIYRVSKTMVANG